MNNDSEKRRWKLKREIEERDVLMKVMNSETKSLKKEVEYLAG